MGGSVPGRDGSAARLVLAHLLCVVAEWAVGVGALVHAFEAGGSRTVGVVSIALLVSTFTCPPLVGLALARWRAHSVRVVAVAVLSGAYAGAAIAVLAGAPVAIVTALVVAGLGATTALHPTGATLLPSICRSTDELVTTNLRVAHGDSASGLVGSLAAGVVVGLAGPEAVFAAAAAAGGLALAGTCWRPAPLALSARAMGADGPRGLLRRALTELGRHPWSLGVLCAASARNLVLGALDVLLVVVAFEALDLGDSGSGYLSALVGAGSLVSAAVTTVLVRRAKLSGGLGAALIVAAGLCIAIGARAERPVVFVALPLIGLGMAVMDTLSRTLLQRSTDPRTLGSMFAALGFVAGIGQLAGSVLAQVALAVGDLEVAFVTLGGILVVLTAVSGASLRRADAHAEVPSVEMALLAGLPMLSSLPTSALERVARATIEVRLLPGEALVVEGEPSVASFVVADGELDVRTGGRVVRSLARGAVIGELALLTSTPARATVTARSPSVALRIDRDPFLVALTGHEVATAVDGMDFAGARGRFRDVVAAHQRDPRAAVSDQADTWLGLGAIGRMLGDPITTDAVIQGAALALASGDPRLLAEAATLTTWPGAFFLIAETPHPQMLEVCEAALAGLDPDDPMRVRVLATLATNLTFSADPSRQGALLDEAHGLAAIHGDPALTAAVLNAEFISAWEPGTLERREVISRHLRELGTSTGDAELTYLGGFFGAYCVAERGRLVQAREELLALRALLPATHNQWFEFLGERLLLSIDVARSEPGVDRRIDALAERHAATHADTDGTWALQTGTLALQAGELGPMVPFIATMLDGPHARTWRAALALAHLAAGEDAAAAALVAEQGDVPRDYFWVTVLQGQAEVAAALGLTERCAELLDQLAPYCGRVGITASGSLCFGLVSRTLGALAAALGSHDEALDLLGGAVEHADREGMAFEAVVARRQLAAALRGAGDEAAARRVVAEALPLAAAGGFAGELRALRAVAAKHRSGRPLTSR